MTIVPQHSGFFRLSSGKDLYLLWPKANPNLDPRSGACTGTIMPTQRRNDASWKRRGRRSQDDVRDIGKIRTAWFKSGRNLTLVPGFRPIPYPNSAFTPTRPHSLISLTCSSRDSTFIRSSLCQVSLKPVAFSMAPLKAEMYSQWGHLNDAEQRSIARYEPLRRAYA